MSPCKTLQYWILNNPELNWLKREKSWKFDTIDKIMLILLSIVFLSAHFFTCIAHLLILIVFPFWIIGTIRQIKSVPCDIESKLMSPLICAGLIFVFFVAMIGIANILGRIL